MRTYRRSKGPFVFGVGLVILTICLLPFDAFAPSFGVIKKFASGELNAPVSNNSKREFIIYVPDSGYIWAVVAQVHFSLCNTDCMSHPGSSGAIQEVGLRLNDPATGTWILLKHTDGGIGEVFDGTFDDDASGYPGFVPNCSSLSGTYEPREPL